MQWTAHVKNWEQRKLILHVLLKMCCSEEFKELYTKISVTLKIAEYLFFLKQVPAPYFAKKETLAQRGEWTCPRSHSNIQTY